MALFTDGPPTTALELQRFENAIFEAASTERIDIDAKIALAQEEIAAELLLFLDRNSMYDRNLASSGEFVGDVAGSVGALAEKEVKLPACGIERALLQFLRFEGVDERAAFIVDPVVQNLLDAFPS